MKQLGLLLLMVFFGCGVYSQLANPEYKTYTDAKNGITIKYPANWNKKEVEGTEFFFMRPKEEAGQKFAENINLIIDPPEDLDLIEYAGVAKTKLSNNLKDYREVSSRFVKINNRDFFEITYTFTYNKLKMYDIHYVTIQNNQSYSITCSALESTFKKFQPVFETMMKSLIIK